MAHNLSDHDLDDQKILDDDIIEPEEVALDDPEAAKLKHYFCNENVENLLRKYIWTACTDVSIRDQIMGHASELITQIIRKQNLHTIYVGQEESSFGDLVQTAYCQLERTLYKFRSKPHCRKCYSPDRPVDSILYTPHDTEYGIITYEELFVWLGMLKRHYSQDKLEYFHAHKQLPPDKKSQWSILGKIGQYCPHCNHKLDGAPEVESAQGRFGGSETIIYRGGSKVFNMWCLSPDTMLLTNKGIIEIGEVGNNNLGVCDIDVYGPEGLHKATAYVKFPKRPTIKVTTQFGYNLEGTLDHYLPVLRDGEIEKTRIGDLKHGDLLGIQYDQQCFGTDLTIDYIPEHPESWQPPLEWTEELAYIIGLVVSEGSISRSSITICNTNSEVEAKLNSNHLGLTFKRVAAARVSCTTGSFCKFVAWLGLKHGTRAWTKFIPKRILRAPRNIILACLQGMFDGDGHSNRHSGKVGYTTTSPKLLRQLRVVLANLGMISQTRLDPRKVSHFKSLGYDSLTRHTAWQLELSITDSKLFYDHVGFGILYKQAKQVFMCSKPFRFTDVITTKYLQKLLLPKHYKPLRNSGRYKHLLLRKKQFAVPTMSSIVDCLQLDEPFLNDRIADYTNDGHKTMWLPVEKLEPSESESVDIEVPSSGLFTANGISSTNSQVSRTVILAYIKKEGRDRKNIGSYRNHLTDKTHLEDDPLKRFFQETESMVKHNDDHARCLRALEQLVKEDSKPHDGLIGKLVERSGLSRSLVASFIRMLRLRSHEFTDSPLSQESPNERHERKICCLVDD